MDVGKYQLVNLCVWWLMDREELKNEGTSRVESHAGTETAWWKSVGAYRQFDETTIAGKQAAAWMSEEAKDESWDQFLQQNPTGQFQQSSMWARAKASEN
jgi:hypothetical protein